jgi:hypothetical protein
VGRRRGDQQTVFFAIPLILAPVGIVLGVAPDLESALYFTVAVLILLAAGCALLELVCSQRRGADRCRWG